MIVKGILNPQILSLIARVRHTNTLVISDRGFPYWPMIETVDISLVDDVPTVLQVFEALKAILPLARYTWRQNSMRIIRRKYNKNFRFQGVKFLLHMNPILNLNYGFPMPSA